MTKEEAIARLKVLTDYEYDEYYEALEMAIKVLEQEPCWDCISRQTVLNAIDTYDKFGYTETGCFVRDNGDYVPYIHFDDVIKCIKNAPSVNPQPKTGHWIIPEDIMWKNPKCSECGFESADHDTYCPHCGAKLSQREE